MFVTIRFDGVRFVNRLVVVDGDLVRFGVGVVCVGMGDGVGVFVLFCEFGGHFELLVYSLVGVVGSSVEMVDSSNNFKDKKIWEGWKVFICARRALHTSGERVSGGEGHRGNT